MVSIFCVSITAVVGSARGDDCSRDKPWSWLSRVPTFKPAALGSRLGLHDAATELAFVVEATRASEDWSLRAERDGIRVWRRSVIGSPHDEVRGNGLINASPRQVLALLRKADANTVREYNPTCATQPQNMSMKRISSLG